MPNEEMVILMCELEQTEIIDFLKRCELEGVSFSEKVTQLILIFLPRGDNHLLMATA